MLVPVFTASIDIVRKCQGQLKWKDIRSSKYNVLDALIHLTRWQIAQYKTRNAGIDSDLL